MRGGLVGVVGFGRMTSFKRGSGISEVVVIPGDEG